MNRLFSSVVFLLFTHCESSMSSPERFFPDRIAYQGFQCERREFVYQNPSEFTSFSATYDCSSTNDTPLSVTVWLERDERNGEKIGQPPKEGRAGQCVVGLVYLEQKGESGEKSEPLRKETLALLVKRASDLPFCME